MKFGMGKRSIVPSFAISIGVGRLAFGTIVLVPIAAAMIGFEGW
jgi:hypothetical protein